MGPADALFRKDKIKTCDDNWEITLLKGKDHYFHIRTIDATLAKKISSSSDKDPIVVRDASLTQTYSFLPASWAGNTHEEIDVLPIGDREEKGSDF